MARYTKESVQRLREAVDIIDLIGRYVPMKKAGGVYKGRCPFHDEKTPSFVVQKASKHYHCFGCGAHGDAVAFLMQYERLDFKQALLFLSERYAVPLDIDDSVRDEHEVSQSRLKQLLDRANQFFHAFLLHSQEGSEARAYLQNRGYGLSFLQAFSIGYAPASGFLLKRFLHSQGYSEKELQQAGLLSLHEGRAREFFSNRITFPILDSMGACIGFSARKFHDSTYGGKYINTPETVLFKKAKVFFGLFYSKKRIIKEGLACIVEGQLDALKLIEAGFDYTVATLGTAFNVAHIEYLRALGVSEVMLAFDQDEAGVQSVVKAGQLLMKKGIGVKIVLFAGAKDPDELLQKFGKKAWYQAVIEAKEYIPYLVEKEKLNPNWSSPVYKDRAVRQIAGAISEWENPIHQYESLKQLALLAGVPYELLSVNPAIEARTPQVISAAPEKTDQDLLLELDLIRWMISSENLEVMEICLKNLTPDDFHHKETRNFFTQSLGAIQEKRRLDFLQFAEEADIDSVGPMLRAILSLPLKADRAVETVRLGIANIKRRNHLKACEEICFKMKEYVHDEETLLRLAREYDNLRKDLPMVL